MCKSNSIYEQRERSPAVSHKKGVSLLCRRCDFEQRRTEKKTVQRVRKYFCGAKHYTLPRPTAMHRDMHRKRNVRLDLQSSFSLTQRIQKQNCRGKFLQLQEFIGIFCLHPLSFARAKSFGLQMVSTSSEYVTEKHDRFNAAYHSNFTFRHCAFSARL